MPTSCVVCSTLNGGVQQNPWQPMPVHLLQSPHQQLPDLGQHSPRNSPLPHHMQMASAAKHLRLPLLHSPQHSLKHPHLQLRPALAARHTQACSLPGPRQMLLHQLQPFRWASVARPQRMNQAVVGPLIPLMDTLQPLLRVLTDPCMCSGDNRPTQMRPQIPCRPSMMSVPKLMWVQTHAVTCTSDW